MAQRDVGLLRYGQGFSFGRICMHDAQFNGSIFVTKDTIVRMRSNGFERIDADEDIAGHDEVGLVMRLIQNLAYNFKVCWSSGKCRSRVLLVYEDSADAGAGQGEKLTLEHCH